jgi:hypothetical protein
VLLVAPLFEMGVKTTTKYGLYKNKNFGEFFFFSQKLVDFYSLKGVAKATEYKKEQPEKSTKILVYPPQHSTIYLYHNSYFSIA